MRLGFDYISASGLDELKNYKYHGTDKSLIANYVMQPFWRYVVEFLPLWLAPNLVTLLGFFAIVGSYLLLASFTPLIVGEAPSWVYIVMAVCLFWYQTMDAIDGKQARRTGTSSPLGELFDHGCDAMTTVFMGLSLACTMQLGTGWFSFFVTLTGYAVFFMAQWEEYFTGTMDLGYMGVTEIQLMVIGFYLVDFFSGPAFWLQEFTVAGYTFPYNFAPTVFVLLGTTSTMASNIISVAGMKKGAKPFIMLIPITWLCFGAFVWAYVSPADISRQHPHEFFVTIGFMFAYITGRIVVNRVCGESFNWLQPILLGIPAAIVYCLLGLDYVTEYQLLVGYMCLAIIQYLHFALTVIDQMCTHMGIRCLRLTEEQMKKNKKQA